MFTYFILAKCQGQNVVLVNFYDIMYFGQSPQPKYTFGRLNFAKMSVYVFKITHVVFKDHNLSISGYQIIDGAIFIDRSIFYSKCQ